ncbi:MAG: hypothetical protein IPK58_09680 [Acidobacteria bacterium]|nr:hypothetical protein [Acidobacteriota bacterium]
MMRISETDSRVTIRDFPLSNWIWGAVFAALFGGFGVFMLYSAWLTPHHFVGSGGQSFYTRGLTILMFVMVVFFVFGLALLFVSMAATPMISTTIDRRSQTILIRRRGLWANDGERYPISQIKEFGIETPEDDGALSFVVLVLANNDRIRIQTQPGNASPEMIAKLNSFIGKS